MQSRGLTDARRLGEAQVALPDGVSFTDAAPRRVGYRSPLCYMEVFPHQARFIRAAHSAPLTLSFGLPSWEHFRACHEEAE